MSQSSLHRSIMRRIYYAYALRVATNPTLVHGFMLLTLMIVLTHFVSLGNVFANMAGMGVPQITLFVINAVSNTELWTLVIGGIFIMTALSLRVTLRTRREAFHVVNV